MAFASGSWGQEGALVFLCDCVIVCHGILPARRRRDVALHINGSVVAGPRCQSFLRPRRLHIPGTALLRMADSAPHLLKFVLFSFEVAVLHISPVIRRLPPPVIDLPLLHLLPPLHLPLLRIFQLPLRHDVCSFYFYLAVHSKIIEQLLLLGREQRPAERLIDHWLA